MGVLKTQNILLKIFQNSYYILPNALFCILIVTNEDCEDCKKMEERKIKKYLDLTEMKTKTKS